MQRNVWIWGASIGAVVWLSGCAGSSDEGAEPPAKATTIGAPTSGPSLGAAGTGVANTGAPRAEHAADAAAPVGASPAVPQIPASTPSFGAMMPSAAGASAPPAGKPATPPAAPGGARFEAVGTNPFVLAAHDPFSTFGADVDTASYDVFRKQVAAGSLPPAASVRVEDFVNFFKYDYPAPAEGAEHPFAISLAAAPNAFGRNTTLLRVGIQAQDPPPFMKKPANLVFLVDTSGSMAAPDKLPLVHVVAKQALEVLAPEDTVAIVTYSTEALVRLPPTTVSRKAEISPVIDGLFAQGSTNGAGGIQLAYAQAQDGFIEGGINHVVLCTDGDFNVGISDTKALVDFIKEKRTSGVTLTALGFGSDNLNDAMMEKVSNAGNGIYSVITGEDHARRYAEDSLLRSFMQVAKDMKIQLEFNPEQVEAYRLIGYENRAIADMEFRDDKVDAGEVGAGHRVTALYELVRKGGEVPVPNGAPAAVSGDAVAGEREAKAEDLVLVKVRYKQPGAKEADPAREVVSRLAPGDVGALFDQADQDLRWVAAVAAFAEILKHSPYATPTQVSALREVVAAQAGRDNDRKEFVERFDAAAALLK